MDKSRMKRVQAFFFATQAGHEPVREWLMELDRDDRREVGRSLMTLEFGWPVGMPLTRAMGQGLHELRTILDGKRNARVFFYIDRQQQIVLLHAFIKQTQTTPQQELDLARQRMRQHQRSDR
jgi:phage-related protein